MGTTRILKKTLSEWKGPFSEQLSEFRGILGAILGMALTTSFMSTCSFFHLYFVKEFPRFGRKISAKIG